ncbi:MAG: NAD-dependent epimerase/dehydratase family protein [Chloroflexi bacterium]|nr:NAD-dependent epimerase/dehydratase family protein [Chloroflexota bacterium]
MRILVTGGAGFIGSHVVDRYLALGHEVAVVDNLVTGSRANVPAGVKLYTVDIRDAALEGVFTDFRPNVVNHHAAQANVPASVADPVYDASVNVLGGLNLLKQSAQVGVSKFIYASSGGAMYGEPDPACIPLAEDAPVRPLSPYGASKQALEAWLGVYQRTFGLEYSVVRYANVYGPRQGIREEGAVIAVFATRMAAGQPVTIDGTGQQSRDFVYVGDCADASVAALQRGAGAAVNIGTGIETTIQEIFDLLAEIAGYSRPPSYGQARQGDVQRIALNPSLASRELGWSPRMALRQGLAETYSYFQEQVGG